MKHLFLEVMFVGFHGKKKEDSTIQNICTLNHFRTEIRPNSAIGLSVFINKAL